MSLMFTKLPISNGGVSIGNGAVFCLRFKNTAKQAKQQPVRLIPWTP
jgi:hypothetical protein